jgi:F0F1-type ATP synthase membrane subunit a
LFFVFCFVLFCFVFFMSHPLSTPSHPFHNPFSLPTSLSPLNGTPTLALQVSVELGATSITENRQGNPARKTYPTDRQQLLVYPPFQLCRTHIKTKLHICYLCAERPKSNPCMLFGWWFSLWEPIGPG